MHIYPRSLTYFCYICAFDSQELRPCRYLVCYQWGQLIEKRGWRRLTPIVYENTCWPTSLYLQIWWLLRNPYMILYDLLVYTFWSANWHNAWVSSPLSSLLHALLYDVQLQSSFLFELRNYRKSHLICQKLCFTLEKLPSKKCANYFLVMQVYIFTVWRSQSSFSISQVILPQARQCQYTGGWGSWVEEPELMARVLLS